MKKTFYLLSIILTVAACHLPPDLNKPESVVAMGDFIYVSNVNGNPTEKDGNGYISKLYKSGKVCTNKFIEGLNAPKGMAAVYSLRP